MARTQDTYKEVKIMKVGIHTVRVFIPDLTEEERNRRMEKIKESAARLLYPELF